MFNRKKVKALQDENAQKDEIIIALKKEVMRLSSQLPSHLPIRRPTNPWPNHPSNRPPKPIYRHMPIDPIAAPSTLIAFAKMIQQKYVKMQSCGPGGCGLYYKIPAMEIDKIASATPIENTKPDNNG